MSSVIVTGVLVEQPNLKVLKWVKYTMLVYALQTSYLIYKNIDSDNLYLWGWIILHYILFGLVVPTAGKYGAKTPHWPALSCFSGAQSMVGVLNSITLVASICSITSLHSMCSECTELFRSGNETCSLPFRNTTNIILQRSWCEQSPTEYIIPTVLMCIIIYVSFMSAISARKMGQTKKIQVVTIDAVPLNSERFRVVSLPEEENIESNI